MDPAAVGTDRARARLGAVRQGHRAGAGRAAGVVLDEAAATRVVEQREGARAPRLPVRGRRRLVRPADPQGDGRLRAAVQARVLARDRREARGRPRGDRGHDQDLGGRRALRAHGGGQRPGERARQGAARRDRRDATRTSATSSSSNFKVRILDERKGTGAVTRVLLDASDGTDTWGSIGVSENIIEASWEALVDSLEAGMLPGRSEHSRTGRRRRARGWRVSDLIPLSRPLVGAREEELVLETLRSGRLSLGPMLPRVRARASPRGSASPHVSAVSSGTAGLHLAIRAAGVEARRRGRHDAVQLRRLRQLPALRGRAARLLRHRPAHAQHRPAAAARGRDRAHDRACCRCTSSATPPTCRPSSELAAERGLWLVEDACEALGAAARRRLARWARAGTCRCSPSTRTSR